MADQQTNQPHDIDLEEFKRKQAKELEEFQKRQEEELKALEIKGHEEIEEFENKEEMELEAFEGERKAEYLIKIDRNEYTVRQRMMTGEQLRSLPQPPIGPDRDLFEVVPGGSDRKIVDDVEVKMRNGLRFFTAPAQINPGCYLERL